MVSETRLGAVLIVFVAILAAYAQGASNGRSAALRDAYNTARPTEELEMACVGLWVGEQNRKYFERERGK